MEAGPSFLSKDELPLLYQLHQQLQHILDCLQSSVLPDCSATPHSHVLNHGGCWGTFHPNK